MSEKPRKPATFKLDDENVVVVDTNEPGRVTRGTVRITPEAEPTQLPVPIETPPLPVRRRGFGWGTLFWAATAGLVVLGSGLGIVKLIEDLFARSESLGYVGLGLAAAAGLALAVVTGREIFGLMRLATIEKLHARATEVLISDDRDGSRAIVDDLLKLAHQNPHLARARAALTEHAGDIIDGADMIRLAERELMTPLDQEARRIVSSAAQRVSIVTAVSPRALFDVVFVFAASLRHDPPAGAALWRAARRARHDQPDAPCHRAPCDYRRHGRRATAWCSRCSATASRQSCRSGSAKACSTGC